jgi:hypothetical protein
MSYPTSIDSIPQPTATSPTNNPGAAEVSTVQTNAIVALETKLGTGASTPVASTLLRGTGTGTSAFAQANLTTDVTGTLPVANGGTGNTTGTAKVNANLTGPITSSGNATSIASQTGIGSKFVVDTSPTLVTPNIGTPSAAVLTNATGLPGTGMTGTYTFNTQAITTNTTQTAAIMKEGWNYLSAASGNSASSAITFPTAFPNSIVNLQFGTLGFVAGTAPSSITNFNTAFNGETFALSATSISTSGFTFNLYKTAAFGGITNYYGFWWRAVGT